MCRYIYLQIVIENITIALIGKSRMELIFFKFFLLLSIEFHGKIYLSHTTKVVKYPINPIQSSLQIVIYNGITLSLYIYIYTHTSSYTIYKIILACATQPEIKSGVFTFEPY